MKMKGYLVFQLYRQQIFIKKWKEAKEELEGHTCVSEIGRSDTFQDPKSIGQKCGISSEYFAIS